MDNKCPVKGCANTKEHWHLTCASHWRQVPRHVQAKVYRLYRTEQGSEQHRVTCLTIVDILNYGVHKGTVWP